MNFQVYCTEHILVSQSNVPKNIRSTSPAVVTTGKTVVICDRSIKLYHKFILFRRQLIET